LKKLKSVQFHSSLSKKQSLILITLWEWMRTAQPYPEPRHSIIHT